MGPVQMISEGCWPLRGLEAWPSCPIACAARGARGDAIKWGVGVRWE